MNTPLLDGIIKEAIPWHQIGRPVLAPVVGGLLGGTAGYLADGENRWRGALTGAGIGGLAGLAGSQLLNRTAAGQRMMTQSGTKALAKDLKRAIPEGLKKKDVAKIKQFTEHLESPITAEGYVKVPYADIRKRMDRITELRKSFLAPDDAGTVNALNFALD